MKCVYPVALAAAALLSAIDAWRIESTPAAPPADILGEHQELAKTWTVYSTEPLEKLHITIPGPVFIGVNGEVFAEAEGTITPPPTPSTPTAEEPEPVPTPAATTPDETDEDGSGSWAGSVGSASGSGSFDAVQFPADVLALRRKEQKVATIVVSGNSSTLLELLELVPLKKGDENGLRIHLKNEDAHVEGYVLTKIDLAVKHALRHLSAAVASSVDVAHGVVVAKSTEKKLKLSTAGATDVFISQQSDMHVNDLAIDVAGSGSVQLIGAGVKVNGELSTSVAGDGSIALHVASVKAEGVKTTLSGSGAVYVDTKTFEVEDLTTEVYGAAFASFHVAEKGVAKNQKVTVAGAGAVYAGSIVAEETEADLWGSGIAYVQTKDKLKASTSWSGNVYYVGVEPEKIKTSGWFFWRSSVTRAEEDKVVIHEAEKSPAVYPEYVSLLVKQAARSDEPLVVFEDTQSISFAMMQTKFAAVAHGPNGFLVFGAVAVALVAVAMVAQSYQQHRVRRHYTPLV